MEGTGYIVGLKASDPRHYGAGAVARKDEGDLIGSFASMFKSAIDDVNGKQVSADKLIVQAGTKPDTVDVHEVMNAISEAELSMNLTKAITDRVLRAYQEITNMR
ncbi:MAG: flagellar hook-basal body complex protein FliE [Spirochaetes bacterium]|nr:flagellar hook-basal body complex protein FliE [Spirochaetota bacterium]